jgi:hypothetical protein
MSACLASTAKMSPFESFNSKGPESKAFMLCVQTLQVRVSVRKTGAVEHPLLSSVCASPSWPHFAEILSSRIVMHTAQYVLALLCIRKHSANPQQCKPCRPATVYWMAQWLLRIVQLICCMQPILLVSRPRQFAKFHEMFQNLSFSKCFCSVHAVHSLLHAPNQWQGAPRESELT